jgi:hypothetical protein
VKLKYAKATRSFPSNLEWKDFTGWILEITPQFAGYEMTAKITSEEPLTFCSPKSINEPSEIYGKKELEFA